jgi:uncharacterized membrane protein YccC
LTDGAEDGARRFHRSWSDALRWVREKDPGLLAVKRSVRAAIVMPLVFGVAHLFFVNAQVSLFAAFGSFALLLLVDFPGRPRTRLVSYVTLFFVGGCLVAIGTLVSTDKPAAVAVMAAVGFAVLFAGIVSPQVATASTATLLVFVLPVAVAQPTSSVGPRLAGWALAAAVCIPACMVIWPTPWHDNLRRRLAETVAAVSRLVGSYALGRGDPEARAAVIAELSLLHDQFAGTPYPPTGAAASAVALAKLVGRVEWIAGNAIRFSEDPGLGTSLVRRVNAGVAETLRLSASIVCDGDAHPVHDAKLATAVQGSIRSLDHLISVELDAEVSMAMGPSDDGGTAESGVSPGTPAAGRSGGTTTWLDPSFSARTLAIATEMTADAALEAAGAQAVGDRRLGPEDPVQSSLLWGRLFSHLSLHSVWFRNAVRGAAGLALAVAVVEVTDVEHGFWVVLGTLSVLRSNALGTGATALRAVGGTAVGFVVGSAVMIGVAGHAALLWILLPLAVLVSGIAPSMISFAAGQAGFTLVVIILFNIIEPVGWKVGLTRIEDVAIGCAVSIVVGLLFWPRGATAALGRALADAFVMNSGYLVDAIDHLTITTRPVDTRTGQRASHRAYLRLDDAFRQFLAERGAKVVPVEVVAGLFTGSNRIRMAAFMLSSLPAPLVAADESGLESTAIAETALRESCETDHRWYEEFAELLSDSRDSLDPPPLHDQALHHALLHAFEDARDHRRIDQLQSTLRMLWADEILESQRQVQVDLADSANLFAHRRKALSMI